MTTPGDILDQAIAVYNTQDITNEELADIIGFDDDEREMMRMFWDKCFNGSWILLTKEMVSKYLSDETGRNMMCHFMEKWVIKFGRQDIDYMEVDKTHELVQDYLSSPNWGSLNTAPIVTTNKFYIITGHYFKSLLMMATSKNGLKARSYYMKIEMLVVVMRDYISNKLRHELRTKDTQIDAKDTQIHDLSKKFRRLDISHKQLLQKRSYPMFDRDGRCKGMCLYVIRNTMEGKGRYKFGIAKSLNARLKQHRTDMPLSIVIAVIYTTEARTLENVLKIKLKKLDKLNPVNHEFENRSKIDFFAQKITSDELLHILNSIIEVTGMSVLFEEDDIISEYNEDITLDNEEDEDEEDAIEEDDEDEE